MEQLDVTQTAASEILFGVCCRDPPTRRDDLIALFGGGATAAPGMLQYRAMKALRHKDEASSQVGISPNLLWRTR